MQLYTFSWKPLRTKTPVAKAWFCVCVCFKYLMPPSCDHKISSRLGESTWANHHSTTYHLLTCWVVLSFRRFPLWSTRPTKGDMVLWEKKQFDIWCYTSNVDCEYKLHTTTFDKFLSLMQNTLEIHDSQLKQNLHWQEINSYKPIQLLSGY